MDYYFKNANLILEGIQGDFAVEKGKMRFHGLKDPDRYDQVTDLQGRIVLKGFCDLHTHLDKDFWKRCFTCRRTTPTSRQR